MEDPSIYRQLANAGPEPQFPRIKASAPPGIVPLAVVLVRRRLGTPKSTKQPGKCDGARDSTRVSLLLPGVRRPSILRGGRLGKWAVVGGSRWRAKLDVPRDVMVAANMAAMAVRAMSLTCLGPPPRKYAPRRRCRPWALPAKGHLFTRVSASRTACQIGLSPTKSPHPRHGTWWTNRPARRGLPHQMVSSGQVGVLVQRAHLPNAK